jgi:ATP-binding cassette subfamily E protein 1
LSPFNDSKPCLIAQDPPEWSEILTYFRGSELQNYFTKVLEDDLKTVIKPQYVDQIPKAVKGSVGEMIKRKAESGNEAEMIRILGNKTNYPSANFIRLTSF